jgi:hypothetical protein
LATKPRRPGVPLLVAFGMAGAALGVWLGHWAWGEASLIFGALAGQGIGYALAYVIAGLLAPKGPEG